MSKKEYPAKLTNGYYRVRVMRTLAAVCSTMTAT